MKVLFLAPYPQKITPSQRFRFEHYLDELQKHEISYAYKTFVAEKDYDLIFKHGNDLKKIWIMLKGMARRFFTLFTLKSYDYIFIHREAAPFGPPILEWLIAKLWRKKIIYDFDDAIWIPLSSAANPIAAKIKCTWKVARICKWSRTVTTGNRFLADYASQFCNDVRVIPTVVDTEKTHNKTKNQEDRPLTIGWTGTFTNFINLPLAIPAIRKLRSKYQFEFLIIADKDPELEGLHYTFIKWNKETEMDDLIKMNIGIMPLLNTDVQLGKCGFKAIQYMSLGIPPVVTPIGVNNELVRNGTDGFWAGNDEEWYHALEQLIVSNELRSKTGIDAQKKIINHYSVKASTEHFINLFK